MRWWLMSFKKSTPASNAASASGISSLFRESSDARGCVVVVLLERDEDRVPIFCVHGYINELPDPVWV